jgi:hypothetical protein
MTAASTADLRRKAAELGLTRLSDADLALFEQGARSARELAQKLPRDLSWTEENALVYAALAPKAGGRR